MNSTAIGSMFGALLLLAGLLHGGTALAASPAGEVVKLMGRASVISPEGGLRRLDQGGTLNKGDVVVTAAGSFVRMRLSDGGYIVLRPNTRFQIEDYEFADKAEESRSVFNLLKGGFRAAPLLLGASRKGFLGTLTGKKVAADRDAATVAAGVACIAGGADILRVHAPGLMRDGARVADAVYKGLLPAGMR